MHLNKKFQFAVVAFFFTTIVLLWFGASMASFRVNVDGVVGVAMDFGRPGSANKGYSVFSIAALISKQAKPTVGDWLGMNFTACLFIFCSLLVPFMQMLALGTIWTYPLTLQSRRNCLW